MKVKRESEVAQLCPALHDPMTAAYQAPLDKTRPLGQLQILLRPRFLCASRRSSQWTSVTTEHLQCGQSDWIFFFSRGPVLKVFTEFDTALLLFYILFFWPVRNIRK